MNKTQKIVKNIGMMYTEEMLVFCDVPLCYVAKDDDGNRYVFSAIDPDFGKYVISKTTNERLLDMLTRKISVYDALKQGEKIFVTEYDDDYYLVATEISSEQLTDDMLPDRDLFLIERNKVWIDDYAAKLNNTDKISEMRRG